MTLRSISTARRGTWALLAIMVAMAMFTVAPAIAQTSVVTEEDCEAGRIVRNGQALSEEECRALIGQRVNLAQTGFEAWMLIAAGGVLMAGAAGVVLVRRRPAGGTTIA